MDTSNETDTTRHDDKEYRIRGLVSLGRNRWHVAGKGWRVVHEYIDISDVDDYIAAHKYAAGPIDKPRTYGYSRALASRKGGRDKVGLRIAGLYCDEDNSATGQWTMAGGLVQDKEALTSLEAMNRMNERGINDAAARKRADKHTTLMDSLEPIRAVWYAGNATERTYLLAQVITYITKGL